MTTNDILDLMISAFGFLGTGMIAILSLFVGIGVAYLVFKFGWRVLNGRGREFLDELSR